MSDFVPMFEVFGGVAGGLGLFIVGMHSLSNNLQVLASRRLRTTASRWTANRFSALAWGVLAGGITQSMSGLVFILVGCLRSGLIATRGALAVILGGCVGVSALVLVATFDLEVFSFYVLGAAGALMVSERLSKYRLVAASVFGGAMIVLGLILLRDAAAPLAHQPWFRDLLAGTGESLVLAFLVAALLTAIVQSTSAVCVFGVSLAATGVISMDQAIMVVYGSCIGSSVILYLLSTALIGRARQISMYMVLYNVLICAVLVPLLYIEIRFDIPLMKALVLSIDMEPNQQLALVFLFLSVFPLPLMLAGLEFSESVLERFWPASPYDKLAAPEFIDDRATVDVGRSLALAELEQNRVFRQLSRYFDTARRNGNLMPLRAATRGVLNDTADFLNDLETHRLGREAEVCNAVMNRQKLLTWLEAAVGGLCEALGELPGRRAHNQLRVSICEGVDGVLLAVAEAMETNDEVLLDIAGRLTGNRGATMRRIRMRYLGSNTSLQANEASSVLAITNMVEEVFFFLSRLELNAGTSGGAR